MPLFADAIRQSLLRALETAKEFALPAAVLVGLLAIAVAVVIALGRDNVSLRWPQRMAITRYLGYVGLVVLYLSLWAALEQVQTAADQTIRLSDRDETARPTTDGTHVIQYGPVAAALKERTFTRTVSVPASMSRGIEERSLADFAPMLYGPVSERVLRVDDSFKRAGDTVLFTRNVTQFEELPLPFEESEVRATFSRLREGAYEVAFQGDYSFKNETAEPVNARLVFPVPPSGTVRDMRMLVDGRLIPDPNKEGNYEWTGSLQPNERKRAVISYRMFGANRWHYDVGSRRRRVKTFRLEAQTNGPVRFLRGSIQPSRVDRDAVRWDLSSVITNQQISIGFPTGEELRETYRQGLMALPAAFAIFLVSLVLLGWRHSMDLQPGKLALGLFAFAVSLAAAGVLHPYIGFAASLVVAPVGGAILTALMLGVRSMLASLPAALIPAAFLSPTHTGLFLLLIALAALAIWFFVPPLARSSDHAISSS